MKINKKQITEIIGILKLYFQKCGWMDNQTGIVIAGYGEMVNFTTRKRHTSTDSVTVREPIDVALITKGEKEEKKT